MALVDKFKADLVKQQDVYATLQDLLDAKLEEQISKGKDVTIDEEDESTKSDMTNTPIKDVPTAVQTTENGTEEENRTFKDLIYPVVKAKDGDVRSIGGTSGLSIEHVGRPFLIKSQAQSSLGSPRYFPSIHS